MNDKRKRQAISDKRTRNERLIRSGKIIVDNRMVTLKNFYKSWDWKKIRYKAFEKYGRKCLSCGATNRNSVIVVDHVKPVSTNWSLRLDIDNLQILCESCNMGKSNDKHDDFRDKN